MRWRLAQHLLAVLTAATLASGTAAADTVRAPEPALWEIHSADSTVYLFGSVHMLPRDWDWRTKPIDAAIRSSDAFVFETAFSPRQMDRIRIFIRERGKLPEDQRLSRMLSPRGLSDFKKALTLTPLDPAAVNGMRPWLALMVLGDYQVQNGPLRSFVEEGVDTMIEEEARERGKPVRQLETAQSQLELLAQATPDDNIEGFELSLHELIAADDTYTQLLEAWTAGRQSEIADILAEQARKNPEEHRLLLGTRNRNWLPQIESLMVSKHTTFITVGAAHLAGRGSVLDMLCARGWTVRRVRTGPSIPPPACPAFAGAQSALPLQASQAAMRR
jgi:uncharacterized protein